MIPHLTPRQREVCILLVAGCSVKDISRRLQLSPRAVEHYKDQLFERLEVRTLREFLRLMWSLEQSA